MVHLGHVLVHLSQKVSMWTIVEIALTAGPVNQKYPTGTVPVNENYPTGTVPVNKKYPTGTLHWVTKLKKLAGAWDISTNSIRLGVTDT